MKKYLVLIFAATLVWAMVGNASAIVFTDEEILNKALWGNDSLSWTHKTPGDLEVPYDTVNTATLEIFACGVGEGNDQIFVDGSIVGTLENASWVWTGFFKGYDVEGAEYDIASVFTPKWTSDSFDVTLKASEFWKWFCWSGEDWLYVKKSIFTIDYDNGYGPGPAPVPEPATMLLLGTGLAGLAVARRRKAKEV